MIPTETSFGGPEDAAVRYDLAGNPLAPLPKAEGPLLVLGLHFAPPPAIGAGPPGSTAAPGGFVPPPGSYPGYAPAPARNTQGPALYLGLGAGFLALFPQGAMAPEAERGLQKLSPLSVRAV